MWVEGAFYQHIQPPYSDENRPFTVAMGIVSIGVVVAMWWVCPA